MTNNNQQAIASAIEKRASYIQEPHTAAFRLLNGFLENIPDLIIDIFGQTIVFHDYSDNDDVVTDLVPVITGALPWLVTGLLKKRRSKKPEELAGKIIFGETLDTFIIENGVTYALDLNMNQDASFYLDTRNLRHFLKENMKDKSVLNTFAYTGSLGVAALAGGAKDMIQLDLNKRFLTVAKRSVKLNGLVHDNNQNQEGDFWSRVNHFKLIGKLFDCVILDPPVYSRTSKGIVDTTKNYYKLINKVRPVIADGGYLITINNALFQSGAEHTADLESLCQDGYLSIESTIDVPEDCIGALEAPINSLPSNPAPYNHSTKITVLRVKRKQQ